MKIKRIEIALAVGLLLCILTAALSTGTQAAISGKLVRLHVLANSDSPEDQALKLAVRDAILAEIGPEDSVVTDALLAQLQEAAAREIAEQGYSYDVTLSRQWMYFDTRDYDGFALPAGYYDAVRVVIGAGAGQNWWCVMFPALCNSACEADFEQAAQEAGLTDDEIAFIREDGAGYVVRFKIAEVAGRVKGWFS